MDRAAVTHAPTLILNQGQMVTVTVHNGLGGVTNTSLVFPGHDVTSCTGPLGVLTCEAAPGGSASYTFEATNAGTYMYHAGTDVALQVEMGIVGAIIVRPFGYDAINPTAYGHPDTAYEREYLFVLSEMDSRIHEAVEFGDSLVGTEMLGDYFSNYWFINGRTAPDTMAAPGVPWPPTQPYNILPQIHPGERLLMRVISAGRDLHPYHHHGNHARLIARDGRMLSSAPGAGADLSFEVFTIQALPGESYDAIFQWTGQDLGWDRSMAFRAPWAGPRRGRRSWSERVSCSTAARMSRSSCSQVADVGLCTPLSEGYRRRAERSSSNSSARLRSVVAACPRRCVLVLGAGHRQTTA